MPECIEVIGVQDVSFVNVHFRGEGIAELTEFIEWVEASFPHATLGIIDRMKPAQVNVFDLTERDRMLFKLRWGLRRVNFTTSTSLGDQR